MWRTTIIVLAFLLCTGFARQDYREIGRALLEEMEDTTTDKITMQVSGGGQDALGQVSLFYLEDEEEGWVEAGYTAKYQQEKCDKSRKCQSPALVLEKPIEGYSMGQADTCSKGTLTGMLDSPIQRYTVKSWANSGCSKEEIRAIEAIQPCYMTIVKTRDREITQILPPGCNTAQKRPPLCLAVSYSAEASKTLEDVSEVSPALEPLPMRLQSPAPRRPIRQAGPSSLTVTNFNINGAVARFVCRVRLEQYGIPASLANNAPRTTVSVFFKQGGGSWSQIANLIHRDYNGNRGNNRYSNPSIYRVPLYSISPEILI